MQQEGCQVEPVPFSKWAGYCHEVIVSSQLSGDLQHVSDILTLFVLHRRLFFFLNSSLFDSLELSVDHISN